MHVIAAKAVAFKEAFTNEFKQYQQQVINNANALAHAFMEGGVKLVSNGTDNHLMLLDLKATELTGKQLEKALDNVGITANKNTIPFDPQSPFVTSGVRIGTPAVTTCGMKEPEMKEIAQMIIDIISNIDDDEVIKNVKERVSNLTSRFVLYPELK